MKKTIVAITSVRKRGINTSFKISGDTNDDVDGQQAVQDAEAGKIFVANGTRSLLAFIYRSTSIVRLPIGDT